MAYVPVCRTIVRRFRGEANLRMAVSKAVSGGCGGAGAQVLSDEGEMVGGQLRDQLYLCNGGVAVRKVFEW